MGLGLCVVLTRKMGLYPKIPRVCHLFTSYVFFFYFLVQLLENKAALHSFACSLSYSTAAVIHLAEHHTCIDVKHHEQRKRVPTCLPSLKRNGRGKDVGVNEVSHRLPFLCRKTLNSPMFSSTVLLSSRQELLESPVEGNKGNEGRGASPVCEKLRYLGLFSLEKT